MKEYPIETIKNSEAEMKKAEAIKLLAEIIRKYAGERVVKRKDECNVSNKGGSNIY